MARRTFSQYKSEVLLALGNPSVTGLDVEPAEIVNDALEHLAAVHEWNWLTNASASLDVVADQDHVDLPTDFGTLIAIAQDTSFSPGMIPTTWPTLLDMRTSSGAIGGGGGAYWYVVQTGNVNAATPEAGLTTPTLELYPTPSASLVGAMSVVYRRFLRPLAADTDVPAWPRYMDRLLSLLARSMAATDYDADAGGSSGGAGAAYTSEFRVMLTDAMYKDGLSRTSFGMMRGGAAQAENVISIGPLWPKVAPDPV